MKAVTIPRALSCAIVVLLLSPPSSLAQYAERGFTVPFTATGGVVLSERARAADPGASLTTAGFRAVFYPSVRLDSRWYAYSAVEVRSTPFQPYESFYPQKKLKAKVTQIFLGYSRKDESSSLAVKAGRMPSAFGSFPLRYDDRSNALLDQPFAYVYPVKLRPDQMPCGTSDIAHQHVYPVYVEHYCGGSTKEREGMTPVTLYGMQAAEVDVVWHRVDARVQATNSSPANPQELNSRNQHLQWTMGAGFTISQGFRLGVSRFQGPFLDRDVADLLPTGKTAKDFPADGLAVEGQWARGRWSVNGEWHRFAFHYPYFVEAPVVSTGYAEVKANIVPRVYAAFRAAYKDHSRVKDDYGDVADPFLPNNRSFEFALGYHVNPFQTLKAGYQRFTTTGVSGHRNDVLAVQFVTSLNALTKAF